MNLEQEIKNEIDALEHEWYSVGFANLDDAERVKVNRDFERRRAELITELRNQPPTKGTGDGDGV